jgi:RNA polymerase sigma factor (sigma-70 family)
MAETEAVLLQRFVGTGDAQAFAEIIRRHAGLVYGAAWRILTDVDRASDIAQETFLQLMKDAGTVTGSLPGWLHRVATHKAIDRRRRDASRRHRERRYAAGEKPTRELAEWKDLSPHVDQALRELDPELREVLILHFLQGRTTREIAAAQGASQATISRRLGAGVGQLRARLRRRGLLVAVGALSALLGENAVQAAPLPLLTELGKMAMIGGVAAGSATVGAGAGSGLPTLVTTILTAAQAKVVAIAAVAVLGAGVAVTYHEATKRSFSESAGAPVNSQSGSALPGVLPEAEMQWPQPSPAGWERVSVLHGETSIPAESEAISAGEGPVPAAVRYGGMMGSLMGALDRPWESTRQQSTRTMHTVSDKDSEGGPGSTGAAPDPNGRDPNDPGRP